MSLYLSFALPLSSSSLSFSSPLISQVLVVRDCTNITEHDLEPVVNHPNLFKLVVRGRAMSATTWQNIHTNTNLKKLGIDMLPDVEGKFDSSIPFSLVYQIILISISILILTLTLI
jgi:hypothetical protein